MEYDVRICFKVLVKPSCYKISQQTLLPPNHASPIDKLFDNNELEWSTDQDRAVSIYGLMIKLEPLKASKRL